MGTTTTTTRNFTVDTKGSCFMCLKYDPQLSPPVSPYSFQRLSKYLQLDFKNVYNISFSMASVSVFEDSEVLVSLCNQCSTEANKFIKLHKDLELIRKRVNTCIGRIHKLMVDADQDPQLSQEYRDRITLTANPLELIQASIAENLRKETIEKCSKLNTAPKAPNPSSNISTITFPSPSKVTATSLPTQQKIIPAPPPGDNSGVSSTTSQEKEVIFVDLDGSDEDENLSQSEPKLVIRSVTGAAGTISAFPTSATNINDAQLPQYNIQHQTSHVQPESPILTGGQQQPPFTNAEASTSFSALQNFSTDYNFDLREYGIGSPSSQTQSPAANAVYENRAWRWLSDGGHQCKICWKILEKGAQESMNVHSRIHLGIKPISCEHCNQKFRSSGNRRIHTLTYHRKELFTQFRYPAVSNETFQNAIDVAFQNVKKVDTGSDRPHKCPFCPKYYRHKIDVEAHMVNVHFNDIGLKLMEVQRRQTGGGISITPNTDNIIGPTISTTRVSCETCGLKFRHQASLTRHLKAGCLKSKIATQDSPGNNEKQLGTVSDSGQATKSYNLVIKWKCGLCSVIFASQGDLKRHKAQKHGTNSGKPLVEAGTTYKCQYCSKKFRFYHSQRVHMLTLHRYQVFSKYTPPGTSLDSINNGIQRILEKSKISIDNKHRCKFCNRDYAGSVTSILENHILVSHFQEVVNRLKSAVEEDARINESAQVESTTDSFVGPIKEEDEREAEVVLPD